MPCPLLVGPHVSRSTSFIRIYFSKEFHFGTAVLGPIGSGQRFAASLIRPAFELIRPWVGVYRGRAAMGRAKGEQEPTLEQGLLASPEVS